MNDDDFQEILRVQQLMAQRLMQERKTDNTVSLLEVVRELTENGRRKVHTEAVLIEAQSAGILEREATNLLDELQRNNLISRANGFVEMR